MAQAGVIRDFMVALGFKTDNSGLGKMQDAMKGIEGQAKLLNGALMALATGAVIAVRQTASELDKLYFSSQRIGASANNINAYGNAIAQLGGNAEGAVGSLESLAEKMRNSPGYESQINSLGVNTKEANGSMRDRVEVMKDLSGVLSKMPAYQANAYASSLGIDQNTLLAMRDGKFMANMDKYQKIQKELGMSDDLTKSGNEFMTEYRDLTMMTKTGFQVIVMQAGKALIPILKLLNQLIMKGISAFSQLNPQIKEGLAIGLRFALVSLVFGAFIKTFGLLFKFIPMIKGFIGLLKLFRLAFLASPIGIILALASALYLLYDDYKTWRDGGKSLFDWSKDVDKYIHEASIKYKIDEKILRGFVKMEAGWTGAMSPTGAIGTGQFVQATWNGLVNTKEGKDIGMTKINKSNFRKSNDPRHNKHINTLATGLLAKQNAEVLKKYGIPITGENLYLAHNIGAVTFAKALTGKGANEAGRLAMRQNGMKKGESPKQFVERQKSIYMKHYNTANKENPTNVADISKIKAYSMPNRNPHKGQVNSSNLSASNVTIHQSFKTDMNLNGVSNPMDAANAVKRQQENSMAIMARAAQGVFV